MCVCVVCQWSICRCWKMAVIYIHEKELNCGLFLVNRLASGCASLQLVAGKEVRLAITSK